MPMIPRIWVIADRARAESLAGLDSVDRQRLIGLLERIRGNLLALVEGADEPGCGAEPAQVARTSTPGKRKLAAVAARSRARARVQ
jgi:hypothetical protein